MKDRRWMNGGEHVYARSGYALAGIAVTVMGTACSGPAESGENSLPNVLIIMCDDMGYGDLACYGQPYISTPNIDRMAAEGMLFTQAYAGSPVSAPSRSSLMTGQHTGHCEVRGNKEYWRDAPMVTYGICSEYSVSGQHPYDSAHVVLPEIMKDNGYATGMFGKWAGGYEGSWSTPDKRGVDEFYGYICQYQAHLYYPNFLNSYSRAKGDSGVCRQVLEQNVAHPMHGSGYELREQYSADMIHRKAMEWIDSQEPGVPFFGLLTYTLPHAELAQPNDSIVAAYRAIFEEDKTWPGNADARYNPVAATHAQFAGMITRLDAYVGEILELLRAKGLDENTLVIFTSDNGPHEEGGADPQFFGRDGRLRGLKRQCHEGGIRIPFIAHWPGHIEAGSVNDRQIAFYDIMPTLCRLMGIDDYETRYGDGTAECFDGISFANSLLGMSGDGEHEFLYWEFDETDQIAVRSGDWKLIVKSGQPELYDLSTDIHEDRDIAGEHPDVVTRLVDIARHEHIENPYFSVTPPVWPQ